MSTRQLLFPQRLKQEASSRLLFPVMIRQEMAQRELGHKLGIANAIEELDAVNAVQGDSLQAVMLFSKTHALREGIGAPLPPVDRPSYENDVAKTRAQLHEAVFACTWAEGKAMHMEEARDLALDKKSLSVVY